jgi:EAL domain-containing protein (putative c-di-GMP-specific phosphodiesterase class I)
MYAPEQDEYSPSRLALIGELRRAIEQDELLLYYQPQVNLATGQLDGVEALVRWQHPQRGVVPPDEFIPLAEHTGLIAPLSRWVLAEALRQCRSWRDAGLEMRVAVNLSARLLHDEHLVATIGELLQTWDVLPSQLTVEITESAVMVDPGRALALLTRLHQTGVRIAIDDFGTGYSSLAYLKRLPIDEIKIDKSFVLDMPVHDDDATITRSIVDLGHNLGLVVVAEGVETREIWDQLAAMHCDVAQGYYLSRPIPAAELTRRARSLPRLLEKAG